ncbi:calcium-binding protein [Marimonas arenosa]|uniref:Alkaline phosphatase n=1 Tax=Marimonas arenosa TaxID=1795305 RepID=A0AAE4B672_9RHOB|nr:calcium-binding protein [Marimonas arenosa]MDQ2092075.1 hypothetical protein [Marimonas arenosa]
MPVFNLNTTTGAVATASDSLYVVGVNAQVLNTVAAFDFATFTNSTLVVNGLVASATSIGVYSSGAAANNHVTITQSGSVIGDTDGIRLAQNAFVSNAGTIMALTDDGIQIDGAGGTVENTGSIQVEDNGVVINGDNGTVLNTGSIIALDRGVFFVGNNPEVINSGTIIGGFGGVDLSFLGAAEISQVSNTGVIQGAQYSIQGGAGNDTVVNSGVLEGDVLLGGGDDTYDGRNGTLNGDVSGGAGNDTFIVDDAATLIVENPGEGTDEVRATVRYILGDNLENLTLLGADDINGRGNGLANVLTGNVGDNVLEGFEGDDSLNGGAGLDSLYGGEGNDSLRGDNEDDYLSGFDGNDTGLGGNGFDEILGGQGDDSLLGQRGQDTLYGGPGDDILHGGHADDSLSGGSGFDTLTGYSGDDTLSGGLNADRFVFSDAGGGFGNDVITDFAATNDAEKIDLSGVASIISFADLSGGHMSQVGADVVIDAGGGNTITLQNVNIGDLDANDFIF